MSFKINLCLLLFLLSITIGSVFKPMDISIVDELLLFLSALVLLFNFKNPYISNISRTSEYFDLTLLILLSALLSLSSLSMHFGSTLYILRIFSLFLCLFVVGLKPRIFKPQALVINLLDIFILLLGLISAIIPIANIIHHLPVASWQNSGIVGTSFHAPLLAFCYPFLSKKYRQPYLFFVLLFGVFSESRLAIIFSVAVSIVGLIVFVFRRRFSPQLSLPKLYMWRSGSLCVFFIVLIGFAVFIVQVKIAFDSYFGGLTQFSGFMAKILEYSYLYLDLSNVSASDSDRLEHFIIGINSVFSSYSAFFFGHGINASREVLGIRLTGFSRILYDQGFLCFFIILSLQLKNIACFLRDRDFVSSFCFLYALFSLYFFTDPTDSVIFYFMAFPVFRNLSLAVKS